MMKRLNILLCSIAVCLTTAVHAQQYIYPNSFVQDSVGVVYGQSRAMVTIEGEQLLKTSSLAPSNSLHGLMPGVSVLTTGGYNTNASLIFRGRSGPLVLVDGIKRNMNFLANEEIEKIVVLKDAASQALYGMKASGGLILVTTKRGSNKEKDINVSYNYSLATPTALPDWVDASTYASAVNFARVHEGLSPIYSQDEINAYSSGQYPEYYPDVNWIDETLRKWSHLHQATISARGGDDNVKYFSLIKYSNIQGLIKEYDLNSDYSTQLTHSALSVRTNLDINVSKTTTAHINLLGKIYENNTPGAVSASSLMTILYQLPANVYPVKYADGHWGGRSGYPLNPVAQSSYTGYSTYHTRSTFADLGLEQKLDFITPGLTAFAKGSIDSYAQNRDTRSKDFLYQFKPGTLVRDPNGNLMIEDDEPLHYGEEEFELGFSSSLAAQERGTNIYAGFNYPRIFTDHTVNASAFYRLSKYVGLGRGTTYANQDVTGFVDYAFKDKYSVALSLSYYGTNRLPAGSRWGLFPAVSLGWRIDKEFDSENIQKLNLRASGGITGNDDITQYLDKHQFTAGSSFMFTNDIVSHGGMKENSLPSSYYTYEKNAKFNLGVDFAAWDLIYFTADGFYERSYDRLVSGTNVISSMIGVPLSDVSKGIVDYYGFETALNLRRQLGDWRFDVGGNFSLVKNKIVNMNEVFRKYDYQKRTGHMSGHLWGLEVVGFFENQEDIDNSPRQMFSDVFPGDYKYKDQNGDGLIDDYDMIQIGHNSTFPEIYYAFNFDISYKDFGVSAIFQGLANYSVNLSTTGMHRPLINGANLSQTYYDNSWRDGVSTALYPRLTTTGSDNNYRANSVFISDRSYLKLRNVEIWYRLPSRFTDRMNMQDIRFFLRGNDLFSIDNIEVLDPELLGVDYPILKTYQVGLKLTF